MWEEHLSGTFLEAVRVSLAINCSMQKPQQSQMGQAQLGLIKPSALGSLLFSQAKNDQDTGTKHKSQGHTTETHRKSCEVHEANHDLTGELV